jgi:hypothetical protein
MPKRMGGPGFCGTPEASGTPVQGVWAAAGEERATATKTTPTAT